MKRNNLSVHCTAEYGTTGKVSTHGNIYSFGITLLEIFSGRSPTDDIFRDGLTLQGFIGMAFPGKTEEVLDATLLETKESNGDSGVSVHDCLISAVRVGLSCTRAAPYERMSMRDAAAQLQAIRDACVRA
ncbi:hypothetical protein ACQJBY_066586 [Aegilops geniculata]